MNSALRINPKLTNKKINMGTKPKKTVSFGKDLGSEIFKDIKKEIEANGQIKTKSIIKKLKGPFGFSQKKIEAFAETVNDRITSMLIQIQGFRKALKESAKIIAQFPKEKAEAVEKAKKDSADYYSKIIAEKDKEILEAKAHKKNSRVGDKPTKK